MGMETRRYGFISGVRDPSNEERGVAAWTSSGVAASLTGSATGVTCFPTFAGQEGHAAH